MNKRQIILLCLLVLAYLVNGICSIRSNSITADEGSHLSYGIRLLKGQPERVNPEKDNSKMPISIINALPRAVEQVLAPGTRRLDNGIGDTMNGRYISLLFSVLTLLLVFTWSRQLYGNAAGLFSAFLFVCCPNNMANAVLVTTDAYAVFFLLATMYFLWRYCVNHRQKDFIAFALLLALSQLAKQSLFHLYVLAPLCVIVYMLVMKERLNWARLIRNGLILISSSWLIINAGFLFWKMNTGIGQYHFMSSLFQKLQGIFPSGFPVPFSEAFVTGLDQAKYYDQLGGGFPNSSFGNVTILGHSSTGGAFWYYYFVIIFFKTPVTYLILAAWAKWLLFTKEKFRLIMQREFFLLAPMVYYLVLMSFFYKTQVGVRHILFIYPLLFIFCGIVIKYYKAKTDFPIIAPLSLYLVLSVCSYFNNYYPYTNEFIGDKQNAWQYVGASNLNIGQSRYILSDYLRQNPDVKLAPEEAKPGRFVLSIDRYLDTWNTGKYGWLRKEKPVDHVGHAYLLFEIK